MVENQNPFGIWLKKGLKELKELDKGKHAVSKTYRLILSHEWSTSKKSTLYGDISIAHLTSMPTLSLLMMSRSATGAETSIVKENQSSHKPEDKRVSKNKVFSPY